MSAYIVHEHSLPYYLNLLTTLIILREPGAPRKWGPGQNAPVAPPLLLLLSEALHIAFYTNKLYFAIDNCG